MARRKLTEFKAKKILSHYLKIPFSGIETSSQKLQQDKKYVLKVDQGIKGRMKKGLVKLNLTNSDIDTAQNELTEKGYTQFIIEEMLAHDPDQERFISLEREREGVMISFSQKGGINIEDNAHTVVRKRAEEKNIASITQELQLPENFLPQLLACFDELYFSFLEINPLVIIGGTVHLLDLAVEVDDAAEFFVRGVWSRKDFVEGSLQQKTEEEENIQRLAEDSQASLKLDVFNTNGSIFLLLSGGGASIVLADEAYNLGFGKEIANYGEYSGNPNDEETYTYTKNLLSLLLKSTASKKVLVIAGGVANFTDIRKTFKGIIRAMDEKKEELQKQGIKVFVRRGGPFQEQGLEQMKQFLEKYNLYGMVSGPEIILTEVVRQAIMSMK